MLTERMDLIHLCLYLHVAGMEDASPPAKVPSVKVRFNQQLASGQFSIQLGDQELGKKQALLLMGVPSFWSDSLSYQSGDSFLRYHACCLCLPPAILFERKPLYLVSAHARARKLKSEGRVCQPRRVSTVSKFFFSLILLIARDSCQDETKRLWQSVKPLPLYAKPLLPMFHRKSSFFAPTPVAVVGLQPLK